MTPENAEILNKLFKQAFDMDRQSPYANDFLEKNQPQPPARPGSMTPPPQK